MNSKRLLLLHISTSSGHHRASRAIESAVSAVLSPCQIKNVDALDYINPILRETLKRFYYSLIRYRPELWEYLYDNSKVHRRLARFKRAVQPCEGSRFDRLMRSYSPDVVVCTQAYACGIAAAYKKERSLSTPILGVLTDFAPHRYWYHEEVDAYVVPSVSVKQRLSSQGVHPERIFDLGIPVDLAFRNVLTPVQARKKLGLAADLPVLLVMGGGEGFGKIPEIVQQLDQMKDTFQIVVLAGTNRELVNKIRRKQFRHRVFAWGYRQDVHVFMRAADLLVSKPGGLTSAEALVCETPWVIVDPIAGQEVLNAKYLADSGAAVQVNSVSQLKVSVERLLKDSEQRLAMKRQMKQLAKPNASMDIVDLLIQLTAEQDNLTLGPSEPCRLTSRVTAV